MPHPIRAHCGRVGVTAIISTRFSKQNQQSNKWDNFTPISPKSIAARAFWVAQRFTAAIKEQISDVSS
jgi:hypothetical protein